MADAHRARADSAEADDCQGQALARTRRRARGGGGRLLPQPAAGRMSTNCSSSCSRSSRRSPRMGARALGAAPATSPQPEPARREDGAPGDGARADGAEHPEEATRVDDVAAELAARRRRRTQAPSPSRRSNARRSARAAEKAEALAAELAAAEAALKERWSAEARQVEWSGAREDGGRARALPDVGRRRRRRPPVARRCSEARAVRRRGARRAAGVDALPAAAGAASQHRAHPRWRSPRSRAPSSRIRRRRWRRRARAATHAASSRSSSPRGGPVARRGDLAPRRRGPRLRRRARLRAQHVALPRLAISPISANPAVRRAHVVRRRRRRRRRCAPSRTRWASCSRSSARAVRRRAGSACSKLHRAEVVLDLSGALRDRRPTKERESDQVSQSYRRRPSYCLRANPCSTMRAVVRAADEAAAVGSSARRTPWLCGA